MVEKDERIQDLEEANRALFEENENALQSQARITDKLEVAMDKLREHRKEVLPYSACNNLIFP